MRKGHLINPTGAHLSEPAFRRFEPYFVRLLACYPEPLTVLPDILPTSFAARMREAANAFILHGYRTTVDRDTFTAIWKEVVVRPVGTTVVIAPRSYMPQVAAAIEVGEAMPAYLMTLVNPTSDQLLAAANLYLTGATTLPTCITGAIPLVDLPVGVVLQPQADGTHILL